jgi:excisionase family DNA binding protein
MSIQVEPKRFYDLSEVAQGLKLSVFTLRRYIKEKGLKAQKVGRKFFVSSEALKEFLNGTRKV